MTVSEEVKSESHVNVDCEEEYFQIRHLCRNFYMFGRDNWSAPSYESLLAYAKALRDIYPKQFEVFDSEGMLSLDRTIKRWYKMWGGE